jgi:hydrogenase expression/formation protein HypC
MCLGIPAQIVEIENPQVGKVEIGGIRRTVNLSLVDNVKPRDFVIVHAGFAITKLDKAAAEETLALLKKLANELPDEQEDV